MWVCVFPHISTTGYFHISTLQLKLLLRELQDHTHQSVKSTASRADILWGSSFSTEPQSLNSTLRNTSENQWLYHRPWNRDRTSHVLHWNLFAGLLGVPPIDLYVSLISPCTKNTIPHQGEKVVQPRAQSIERGFRRLFTTMLLVHDAQTQLANKCA